MTSQPRPTLHLMSLRMLMAAKQPKRNLPLKLAAKKRTDNKARVDAIRKPGLLVLLTVLPQNAPIFRSQETSQARLN